MKCEDVTQGRVAQFPLGGSLLKKKSCVFNVGGALRAATVHSGLPDGPIAALRQNSGEPGDCIWPSSLDRDRSEREEISD